MQPRSQNLFPPPSQGKGSGNDVVSIWPTGCFRFWGQKWRNRKIIFGTFIYVLWSYQNRKHPVGHIDTLRI